MTTDERGRASIAFRLPDSLTRYRVMALVADGVRFGKGESTLTARLPLMVRPSPPRFLNIGDRFERPVIVQNQTARDLQVDIAARAANVEITGAAGRRVTVRAGERTEVRFPMTTAAAGRARVQVAAVAEDLSDAAEVDLPVWTPTTTVSVATYGHLDEGAVAYPVRPPRRIVPQFGGLDVTTSSTALHALTDAALYLVAYPYECAEQIASRMLAVAALREVLAAFNAPGLPPPAQIEQAVARDIEKLKANQRSDGGFALWKSDLESWPYVSVHVAHALARAREKGHAVPDEMLTRTKEYLSDIENHIPEWYWPDEAAAIVAYSLHVRNRLGDARPDEARALIDEAGMELLSFEARGWLLPVLATDPASADEVRTIRRDLANQVYETAGTAHFDEGYEAGEYLLMHSARRADAILLEAFIDDPERQDLVPKLVEGLMSARTAGRWSNTQENVFVLLALDRYFQKYEGVTPDFIARAWLGDNFLSEQPFRGRSTSTRMFP